MYDTKLQYFRAKFSLLKTLENKNVVLPIVHMLFESSNVVTRW